MAFNWGQPPSDSNTSTTEDDSGWSTRDSFDLLGNLYGAYQSNNTSGENADTIQQGFENQNPFNQYRGLFAGEMFNLQKNPGDIVNTPGYQFSYDQGLQGLFAKQAASGNRFSGQAMTESQQFGQGLASQMYNSEMDRLMTLSGASFAPSGGTQTAANLASNNSQNDFNNAYWYNQLVNNITGQSGSQPNQQFTPWNPGG